MTRTIEAELDELVALAGYKVTFQHAGSYDWFYTVVICDGKVIGRKACCRSYPRAARWAKRRIKRHRKALATLGGLAA